MPSPWNSLARRVPKRVAGVAAVLALLGAGAVAFALEPLARMRLEQRLSDRIGPVASLSVDGSPLSLLRARPDALAVHFVSADLERAASGDRDLDRIARLDVRADRLQTALLRFEQAHIVKRGEHIHAQLRVPPQEVSLRGTSLPVTPQADDGELVLALDAGPRLRVFSEDGRLRIGVDGDGTLGAGSQPLGSGTAVAVDALRTEDRDGGVVIDVDAHVTEA